jgi:Zn/Cd-binding protein ZinT
MPLEKKPFVRYKLDEEKAKEKDKVFTIRLNPKEQEAIDVFKKTLDVDSDGKALKIMAIIGYKCITSLLGKRFLRYLFKKELVRLSDYEDY